MEDLKNAMREKISFASLLEARERLEEKIIQNGGEIDESIESFFVDTEMLIEDKIDRTAKFLDHLDSTIEHYKKKENEYFMKKARAENTKEQLKLYLLNMTQKAGGKLEGREYKFLAYKTAPIVQIDDTVVLPQEYIKTKIEEKIDRIKLKEDLKNGKVVEGCALVENTAFKVSLK